MANFTTAFRKLLPRWLTAGENELVLSSLGEVKAGFAEFMRQGLLARFPEYGTPTALPFIGRDRKLIRGIGESDEGYAARLVQWLDLHKRRGNPFALGQQLRAYCNADVRVRTVDRRGNWFTVDRDGSESFSLARGNWNWDGRAATEWSRFWVIIYPTADGKPWGPQTAAGLHAGTVGTTATAGEVASVRAIVKDWKPAGTRCEWIIVAFDDTSFNPATAGQPDVPGTWGAFGKAVAGEYVQARMTTARYWRGVEGMAYP